MSSKHTDPTSSDLNQKLLPVPTNVKRLRTEKPKETTTVVKQDEEETIQQEMCVLQESFKKVDNVSMIKNKNFLVPKPLDALPLKENDVSLVTTRQSPGKTMHPSSTKL